jgi:PAS domain S-box-containing protein
MEIAKSIEFAIRLFPARVRIAMGQVFLLVAVLLLAVALGLFPNERRAIMAGRSKLSEAVAVQCSAYVQRNDFKLLGATFEPTLRRDPDVLAASIRRENGSVIEQFGKSSTPSTADFVVPIWSGNRKWGSIEVRFRPLYAPGLLGLAVQPEFQVVLFTAGACLALYLLYLSRTLKRLDPSRVMPSRVRSALDTLAEGLILLDAGGRIVLANQALATMVGNSPAELTGVRIANLPWDSSEPTTEPWTEVIRGGSGSRGTMMRLRDAESILRTFSVNCSPVMGDDGISRGVLVSLDDVTQLQRNDAELRKSKEEADAANRAKSDFLARMSHEIRTPMNAILGFADILRRGYVQSEAERQESIETIHSSGLHLLELINDILDLSKIEAGKLQVERCRCAPARIITEVLSVMSVRAAQKGINLEARWDGDVPETIESDPTRLRQALTNLVGNAIKFTESGEVRVTARVHPERARWLLAIDVSDSGIGMTPDVLARIFDPFAQGDMSITRRFGGTGLGLSISKQIAEALGGGITVVSESGKGSTFTLTVDAGSPSVGGDFGSQAVQEIRRDEMDSAPPTVHLDGLRILLAEDGLSNRKLISLVLGRAGAILDCAEDGQTAFEMAARGEYALILMDMQMPVMDGYTAATKLRQRGSKVPIIALTAHAMRGDEEKCRAAGCSAFLSKPINMDLLLNTVAQISRANAAAKPGEGLSRIESSLLTQDPEFREIVDEFIERLSSQMRAIREAWSRGDLDELNLLAHWVKGSGGTAGFPALTEPARQLEHAAREKRPDEIAAAISQLQDLTNRITPSGRLRSTPFGNGPMTAGMAA